MLTDSSILKRYWSDLTKKLVAEGFTETYEKIVRLKMHAQEGGVIAGITRRDIEKRSGKPVVMDENFKVLTGKGKKKIT